MHDREHLFLHTSESVQTLAQRLRRHFDLEPIPHGSDDENEVGLRGPSRTAAATVGYEVQLNVYALDDPEPDEVQAFDGYPLEIAIWLGHDEGTQVLESRLVFERLIEHRPDIPMLLCHDLSDLIAAYLPGRGIRDFPDLVTIYAADADAWRPWVPAGRQG